MIKETLLNLFNRDLTALKNEILAYKSESNLWVVADGISNSGGNLALHLIGNLKHFIGTELLKTDYIRERDKEFSNKNVPVKEIIKEIDEVLRIVEKGIGSLSTEALEGMFPVQLRGNDYTMVGALLHFHAHLSYHLGQINYHRRLLDI